MNKVNNRDLIIDEADYTESDLDHPFAQEAQLVEPDELVMTREQLLARRKQEQAQSQWW